MVSLVSPFLSEVAEIWSSHQEQAPVAHHAEPVSSAELGRPGKVSHIALRVKIPLATPSRRWLAAVRPPDRPGWEFSAAPRL
mmetsp:Transcript_60782/g.131842  ORF Transcript_60782/g.131842 Transcript_60782/m.131842 type:complete len:82 (+) Transcript_60782:209-454(+)